MQGATARKRISFVDAFHQLPPTAYDTMYADTEALVGSLLSDTADRADHYRGVAFVLDSEAADLITFAPEAALGQQRVV